MTDVAARAFPGATSITRLSVYDSAGPDGLRGGSPHLHTASTEAYVVVSGSGAIHTLDASGYHETALEPGGVVWFSPGTIHRAINHDRLEVLVVMSNAGLPEAGDAVMTFDDDALVDPEAYRAAATLPSLAEVPRERVERAAADRRDRAVNGFLRLRDAAVAGNLVPLEHFYASAARLLAGRAEQWQLLAAAGIVAEADSTRADLHSLSLGSAGRLSDGRLRVGTPNPGEKRFGMCGLLGTYNVSGAAQ